MSKELRPFIERTGFEAHKNVAYGTMNSIFFNVEFTDLLGVDVIAFLKQPSGDDTQKIAAYIKENKKRYAINQWVFRDGVLSIALVRQVKRVSAEKVESFLRELSAFLKDNGYYSSCAYCDNKDDIGFMGTEELVVPACPACQEDWQKSAEQELQARETGGTYGRGLLGAILGALLCVTAWLLLDCFVQGGYLCVIGLSFLTFKGYILLKGKLDKGMVPIFISVNLVTVIITSFVSYGLTQYIRLSRGADVQLLDVLLSKAQTTEALICCAIVMFFAVLGSVLILKQVKDIAAGKDIRVKRISTDM